MLHSTQGQKAAVEQLRRVAHRLNITAPRLNNTAVRCFATGSQGSDAQSSKDASAGSGIDVSSVYFNIPSPNNVPSWKEFRTTNVDESLMNEHFNQRKIEELKKQSSKVTNKQRPSYQRKRKVKPSRGTYVLDNAAPPVFTGGFARDTQTLSLIEDRHKAEIYEQVARKLGSQWKNETVQSDRLLDVMTNAIRDEVLEQARPTLTNEFADYDNPYMMKRAAMKRLLLENCARNGFDEALVDTYLDQRPDLIKLRLQAKLPAEVLEPLMAFRGDVRYSFDARRRLEQKVDVIDTALEKLQTGSRKDVVNVLKSLPENQPTDTIHDHHPFRNHFGFESSVPEGFSGGIKQGKPPKPLDEEVAAMRYPTLQRVAHSLPRDPKYKSNVIHTIRVLERSRGWDFASKLRAVNALKEVWENMAPGKYYEEVVERALPVIRKPGMVKFTPSRRWVTCRGLKHIRSLTTQKPLHMRLTKKQQAAKSSAAKAAAPPAASPTAKAAATPVVKK